MNNYPAFLSSLFRKDSVLKQENTGHRELVLCYIWHSVCFHKVWLTRKFQTTWGFSAVQKRECNMGYFDNDHLINGEIRIRIFHYLKIIYCLNMVIIS